MVRTYRLIPILALLISSSLFAQEMPVVRPSDVGVSESRLERLTTTIQKYVDDGRLPGAVVGLAREGSVFYLESFGERDRESGSAMTDDTIFRIASQSKALISVGVMLLQEQGKLLITDPVGKYLPEFLETQVAVMSDSTGLTTVKANRAITIRDLLTHTAGIGYGYGPAAAAWKEAGIQGWYFADRDEPIRETVRRIASLPFDEQPGKRFVYGYNTDILGALVEVVSGMALDRFLEHHIFQPLDMRDTHFYLPAEKSDRLSVVYSLTDDGLEKAPEPGHMVGQGMYLEGPRTSFSGGAGLLSTTRDYMRFLQMLLDDGELNGVRILAPSTVRLMTSDHLDDIVYGTGTRVGLGFWLLEEPGRYNQPGNIGSFGWGGAYHSTYWVDPVDELVVVYFTQLIPAGGLDDHAKLRTLVYQAIEDAARK